MTTATAVSGTSTVTLSNPTIVLNAPSDGNVVTATRSDTNGPININVGTLTDGPDLQAKLNDVALQLAQQNAVADAIVQVVYTGTASSDHGTTSVVLHVFKTVSNADGLVASYMLTPTPVDGQFFNLNVGVCGGAEQTDLDAYALATTTSLQSAADTAAQTARAAADAQVGISDLSGTGEASVTIG